MLKLCSRQTASSSTGADLATTRAASYRSFFPLFRPTSLILPPTQAGYTTASFGHSAFRARLSPAQSLYNRVSTFVHQLRKSKDFFSEWPHRLCQRIRRQDLPSTSSTTSQQPRRSTVNNTAADPTLSDTFNSPSSSIVTSGSSTNCWNGRDFNGYNKPLVEFGKALTTNHPEVSASQTNPVNTMILNLVDKLKGIGAQLTRKSILTPHPPLFETLGVDALNSMSARADRLRAPQPNSVHSLREPNDELIPSSLAKSPGLQMSSNNNKLPQELVDAVLQLSSSTNQEEKDEDSSSGSDDHESPLSDSEDSDSYSAEEEEDDVNCQQADCSDLESQLTNNTIVNDLLPTLDTDSQQSIPVPASPSQENPPTVLLTPNEVRPPTTIKYTIPNLDPMEQIKGNDISPTNYLQPDYDSNQSSYASNHLFLIDPLPVCALIAFTLLVTTLCLRPLAIRLMIRLQE